MIKIELTAKRNRNKSYLVGQNDMLKIIQKLWFSDLYRGYLTNEGITMERWIEMQIDETLKQINNLYTKKTQQ